MGNIVLTEWVTLDGYTSGPDNDMSFVGESFNAEMGAYESEILDTADTLLLGRVTYASFAGAWPFVPDNPNAAEEEKDYARRLNAKRKIVFSRTLERVDWNNSELLRSIDPEAIRKVKQETERNILIYGSSSIVQQLTNLGLIDEYQLLVHPVVVGDGKPLFKSITAKRRLKLASSKPFTSGVVLLTYRPAEEAATTG
jgi:dihydrofolate reductase